MGENMIRLAKENADQNIIGVEPLLNGQCNLADYCLNNSVKNILYIYGSCSNFLENIQN